MRMFLPLAVITILAPSAWATVTANVFLADEETPLPLADPNVPDVYRPIMVGTHLTIFINSDTGGWWYGLLLVPPENRQIGKLSARGYDDDPYFPNYVGSCLEAAGDFSLVNLYDSPLGAGAILNNDVIANPGAWFVLDYYADAIGECDLVLYDSTQKSDELIQIVSMTHIPSRDFDSSTVVDFKDFALLGLQWRSSTVNDPNMDSSPDLNADGTIDPLDTALFAHYWLERTDSGESVAEPNVPVTGD